MAAYDFNKQALNLSDDTKQLCSSLYKHLNITYFNYVRLNKDNSRIILTDRPDWINMFYSNKLHTEKTIIDIETLKYGGYFTWDKFESEKPFQIARDFNIANGITLLESANDYTELYYFATTKDNIHGCVDYQQKIDLFRRFIAFFKDRGRKLLTLAMNSPLILEEVNNLNIANPQKLESLIVTLKNRSFRFIYKLGNQIHIFTKQETICASYYILQLSMKEIALRVSLSPRTVEEYINNIKIKLGCYSKSELIDRLLTLDIIDLEDECFDHQKFFNWNFVKSYHFLDYLNDTIHNRVYLDEIYCDLYLTKVESEVIFYLCHGHSAKKISQKVGCSIRTTEEYINTLRKKLRVNKKSEIVLLCIQYRILDKIITSFPELLGK